jgi:hypothetical protein
MCILRLLSSRLTCRTRLPPEGKDDKKFDHRQQALACQFPRKCSGGQLSCTFRGP